MYPAILQLTNLFPVGTAVADCVICWSRMAHPQTPDTHCSAPSPWHPQGPMGLSPDGWSSSTHHHLPPSPPYQLPCAQRESTEFMEYRPQCIERECIEFTEYQPQCTLKRGLQNPQNMNHHALKGDLYNSQEERPDTCKLPRTMTDMISIVWPKTPCSNPASCVAYKEHCMLIVYTCYPAWDTRAGGIHESTICVESQAEVTGYMYRTKAARQPLIR